MTKLKKCPFCGEKEKIQFVTFSTLEGEKYGYECMVCGAIGPLGFDVKGATDCWNGRDNDWVPVTRRMPEEDIALVLLTDDRYFGTGIMHGGCWKTNDPYVEFEDITHWLELPDIPEGHEYDR